MFVDIDPGLLLARLETRRAELGVLRSRDEATAEPLSWVEVASQAGIHSAAFSRLKAGKVPGDSTLNRLMAWLGITDPFDLVDDPDAEQPVGTAMVKVLVGEAGPEAEPTLFNSTIVAPAGTSLAPTVPEGLSQGGMIEGGGCGCEHSTEAVAAAAESDVIDQHSTRVAAIMGEGRLSESDDPETQALVTRARELMLEGAAGVSIKHDMNPDDMPDPAELDAAVEAEDWDKVDELLANVHARPRHVALVDTAAFSDARLAIDPETGVVSGPVTYEGDWTGDMRRLPFGVLTWDEDLLPIPITMGHEGPGGTQPPIIGYIDKLERVEGVTSSMRSNLGQEAVVAAAGAKALPAAYFKEIKIDKKIPVKVSQPDANGYRNIFGIAAPRGVCHRSSIEGGGSCFQFPGDVDRNLGHFHTGMEIALDDGSTIRPGALTSGGLHVDVSLANRGVSAREVNRHREDTNQILALVHAWDTPYGLAINGVVAANVDEHRLLQALAGAPSVEMWPAGRGRTLVGIHVVPTPAWPVVASAGGSAIEFIGTQPIEFEEAPEGDDQPVPDNLSWDLVVQSLGRMEKALAMLVNDRIADGIPEPEPEE